MEVDVFVAAGRFIPVKACGDDGLFDVLGVLSLCLAQCFVNNRKNKLF